MQVILNLLAFASLCVEAVRVDDRWDNHEHESAAERVDAAEDGETFKAAGFRLAANLIHLVAAFLSAGSFGTFFLHSCLLYTSPSPRD